VHASLLGEPAPTAGMFRSRQRAQQSAGAAAGGRPRQRARPERVPGTGGWAGRGGWAG